MTSYHLNGTNESGEYLIQVFKNRGTETVYRKNNYIFREGESPDYVYFVVEGLIKISQSTEEGQGITLFLRQPEEMFGSAEAVTNTTRQRYARCLQNSTVIQLDRGIFQEMATKDPVFSYAIAAISSRRLLLTQRFVETLISRPVTWRLAWFLVQSGRRSQNQIDVSLQLSHEELSYMIGCSRQTVTETLNKWRDRGLIDYTKKKITIFEPDSFLGHL
ncbi:MAG: Crp/Fnr family transcriptional regulator [Paenibacillus sp.]|nr:Crp/Fnr family transcriptional regulator [Paenibacillus sp.]